MINFFSRPVILVSSTFLIGVTTFFSLCAGGDWDWFEYNSSFAPEAYVQDKSYEQLFYSVNMFYGGDWYDNNHSQRFGESIIADWKQYLENKISDKELKYFILSDSSDVSVSQTVKNISNKNRAASKKYDLTNEKIKSFFVFINLAKSLEIYTNNSSSWDYNTDSMNAINFMSVAQAKKIENVYNLTKEPFLKNRYWFLTMKAYFYSDNRNEAITFFNKTQAKLDRNEMFYRGLSYVAGVLYKNKDYAKSNFMYSVVFDNCPKLRTVATYCFHPQSDNDFKASLDLAKTNSQKASLWALYGYYADEVEAINQIYILDPKNTHLDYLLTRAINLAENKMNSSDWSYYDYGTKTTLKNEDLNNKLYQVISKIAKAKNTKTPYIWNIAAGYFEVIKENNNVASNYFIQAEKDIPNTKLAKEQLKLFQVFNEVASLKKLDVGSENKILPSLKWLFSFQKENNNSSNLRTNFLINWSRNYIASLYKKQGNDVFAELFLREKDFYLNPDRTEKTQNYLLKNKKSDWDIFAQSLYNVNLNDIYDYKAIKLTYNNQLQNAIVELEKSKEAKEMILDGNPFNGNIKDCNDCDHIAYQKTKYSKLDFLKKMVEIQNNLKNNNNDKFSNAILLGNAFYSMSFYGNARSFYDNKIINQYGNYIDDLYQNMLFSNKFSKQYYQDAFNAAKDNEQKAKTVYLLTKIERNEFYNTPLFKPYEVDYISFEGYKKLKKEYATTKYYQDVISECGYFNSFINK
ncbi:MAG: hypothetical protein ABI549_11960 [Flavobacterium sp.]|uniref:hypothetical protein n=1 Tax=Flavobacterium sp. TaxID=239 RepID=UPI0032650022